MSSLADTPRSSRLHIGIFGKRNSGKSSLINALTHQDIALVSSVAGTTTDPVYKSMEIHGIGPVVFIDTAGFDDSGELGTMRVEQTKQAMQKTDIALVVFADDDISQEVEWIKCFAAKKTPVIAMINKADILVNIEMLAGKIEQAIKMKPLIVSAAKQTGLDEIKEAIMRSLPESTDEKTITGRFVKAGDTVLLVMPQDIQAPKGRLILPQVQTIRDLLDHQCLVMSVTLDKLETALARLIKPPELIITDSQVFKAVYEKKPAASRLTSFSVLFADYKGDIDFFVESAAAIDSLTEDSHVLIAEACTHAPLSEDIGREKIPRFLRQKVGDKLRITMCSGVDFPKDLTSYDLIIHCGACMFNRKYVLSRIEQARQQKVPMSNYGVVLAYLSGILNKIDLSGHGGRYLVPR